MGGTIYEYIIEGDSIAPPSSTLLHLNGDFKIKTFFGGALSLWVKYIVLNILIYNGA